jgi:hypothetical protein
MTLIIGRITDWPSPSSRDRGVTFRFDADWAERRSLGSCYVRLLALVGNPGLGSGPAAAALGGVPKVLGNMGALHGSVRPESGTGVVAEDATALQPEPDPGFVWQCDVDRPRSNVAEVEGDRGFTRVVPRGGLPRDCAARVTVTNARVLSSQLFWAFVLAALFSFGLGLVYDSTKDRGTTAR